MVKISQVTDPEVAELGELIEFFEFSGANMGPGPLVAALVELARKKNFKYLTFILRDRGDQRPLVTLSRVTAHMDSLVDTPTVTRIVWACAMELGPDFPYPKMTRNAEDYIGCLEELFFKTKNSMKAADFWYYHAWISGEFVSRM